MLVLLLAAVATACACAAWELWKKRVERRSASVPTLPDSLPLIGHAHKIFGDGEHLFNFVMECSEITNKLGGITKSWIGPKQYFLITDPKIATTVMNSCLTKNYMYKFARPWVGDGLFTADSLIWKRHRKLLNPTFSARSLGALVPELARCARALADSLDAHATGEPFDALPMISTAALDTLSTTMLCGGGGVSTPSDVYSRAVDRVLDLIVRRAQRLWLHVDRLYELTSAYRELNQLVKLLHRASAHALENTDTSPEKKNQNENYDTEERSFVEHLRRLQREGALSAREAREHLDTMVVGGYDTTAATLLYCLLAIGSEQLIQERIYQELREVFGDSSRDVTREDLPRLVYLEAVVKEVTRLYPVGAAIAREVERDVCAEEHTIPAGSSIIMLIWGMNRHAVWGGVDELRPERWLAGGGADAAHYGTFGVGRRSCIGKQLAMMSLKVSLATLCRRYKVRADRSRLRLKFDLLTKPVSGHHLALLPRL